MAGLGLLSLPLLLYAGQSPSVGALGALLFIGTLAFFANLFVLRPSRARRALQKGHRELQLMACFQDLTQASVRWGKAAAGFLTVFGTKVIFPGIGDWDRPYVVSGSSDGQSTGVTLFPHRNTTAGSSATYSTHREVLLSPGDIANIPQGHALVVRSGRWGLIEHTPFFRSLPWTAVLAQSPEKVIPAGRPGRPHRRLTPHRHRWLRRLGPGLRWPRWR